MLKSCVYLFMWRNYEFQYQKSISISKINFNIKNQWKWQKSMAMAKVNFNIKGQWKWQYEIEIDF